jgi:hypothetical protein
MNGNQDALKYQNSVNKGAHLFRDCFPNSEEFDFVVKALQGLTPCIQAVVSELGPWHHH